MNVKHELENEVFGNLVHDLKTPLAAVKGFIELLQQAGELNDKQAHFADRALSSVERMELMIANVLDFTRLQSDLPLEFEECDFSMLVEEAIALLGDTATQRKITLHVEIDPNLGPVYGDTRLLGHALANLLSNAVKYNQEGGNVWLTVSDEQTRVRVEVRDTGIGIPLEDQKRVFDRFYRVKGHKRQADGTGLGLSIAQAIIQKHSGRIWVESKPDEGTSFSFTLPRGTSSHSGNITETTALGSSTKYSHRHETSSEHIDDVDDKLQESDEYTEADSRKDEV